MDGQRFDAGARGLVAALSRRRVLGGLLSGLLAMPGGTATLAVKRRGRGGRRGDGVADGDGVAPGTLAGGIWDESIEICRFDFETGEYEIIAVSPTAVPEHLNQGDTLFLDCCVDTDCAWRPCLVATGCIEGACAYDNTEGAPCDPGDGASGVCDDRGVCLSTGATVAVPAG
jgi:hypothetical protein